MGFLTDSGNQGGGVEDGAAGFPEGVEAVPRSVIDASEIDIDKVFPFLRGGFVECFGGMGDARVVVDGIETAEVFDGLGDSPGHLAIVRNIAGDPEMFWPQFFRGPADPFFRNGGDGYLGTVAGVGLGAFPADSLRSPRKENDFLIQ